MQTPVPDLNTYLAEWSVLHGGYDPAAGSRLVRTWLGLVYRLARPLARRRVSPSAITAASVLVTAAVLPAAWAGGRWPLPAAAVVVASGLLDNLDGAVAVLRRRASAWGYVLDSAADRVCDVLYLAALWLLGAPAGLAVAAGGAMGMLEYLRARGAGAGYGDIGVVSVGERPTRIIVAAVGLAGAGAVPGLAGAAATAGAAASLAVCAVGTVQLGVVLRRALAGASPVGSGRADEVGDDLRGEGHQGQSAAGVGRAAHQEQPGHR